MRYGLIEYGLVLFSMNLDFIYLDIYPSRLWSIAP